MEDSTSKLTLQLDLARSRIRVHRKTLAALGNPEYILLIVNPEEKTLGIIETPNTPGAHRIKYGGGKQCQELYSTSLARQFRLVMPNWINGGKYLLTGDTLPNYVTKCSTMPDSRTVCASALSTVNLICEKSV